MKHAKLSASGSARWLACPGSVRMEQNIPDEQSHYAAEGSAAHELAERCLVEGRNAAQYVGVTFDEYPEWPVTESMAEHVQTYVDYVNQHDGKRFIEQRVDFSPWVPEGFGTSDAVVIAEGVMDILDLKFGQGQRVDAEENTQGMLYGLGALHDFGFIYNIDLMRIHIVQPRLDHISVWEITAKDLLNWGESVKPKARQCLTDDAPLNPGEKQCLFCKARGSCVALAEHSLNQVVEDFDVIETLDADAPLKELYTMDAAETAKILPHINLIQKWLKAFEAHATGLLEHGNSIPGYKLVEGRSIRKWDDENAVEQAMRKAKIKVADMYTKKLISPAQAEKLLGKTNAIITEHSVKPEGKPTLAPENDKRPAINVNLKDGFSDVA